MSKTCSISWNGFLAGLSIACQVFLLGGCGEAPRDPLRLASSPWPGYEPLYLARDLGYLDPARVSLFEVPSADITMESFRNRSTDLATLTLDEALELMHDGTRLRVLLVLDVSNGADAVLARPGIDTLSDLRGKRIAIPNIPLGFYMLSRLLDAAGLARGDVTVIPMSENKHDLYYRQGRADAVITFEPFKSRIMQAGGHVIFDSSRIPDEIFDLLLVHEDVYQARRDELCHIVDQWFRALDYMRTRPDDAALRIGRRLGVDTKAYYGMMQGIVLPSRGDNLRLLGGEAPALLGPAAKLAGIMRQEGLLSGAVEARPAIDPAFAACFSR